MKRLIRVFTGSWFLFFIFFTLNSFAWGGTKDLIILAFGDSITYGMGSSSDGPETGYPILLEKKLGHLFPRKFFLDQRRYSRGRYIWRFG